MAASDATPHPWCIRHHGSSTDNFQRRWRSLNQHSHPVNPQCRSLQRTCWCSWGFWWCLCQRQRSQDTLQAGRQWQRCGGGCPFIKLIKLKDGVGQTRSAAAAICRDSIAAKAQFQHNLPGQPRTFRVGRQPYQVARLTLTLIARCAAVCPRPSLIAFGRQVSGVPLLTQQITSVSNGDEEPVRRWQRKASACADCCIWR